MSKSALLIYEEDMNSLLIIHRLLRAVTEGQYEMLLTATPQEALLYVQKRDVVFAVVDYALPGQNRIDGLQLVRSIRALHPGMFIVMTSIYMTPQLAREAQHAGADACLPKPFPLDHLETLVIEGLGLDS